MLTQDLPVLKFDLMPAVDSDAYTLKEIDRMLQQDTIIQASPGQTASHFDHDLISATLATHGSCLLRGYQPELVDFSQLINTLCADVTYDPARAVSADAVQKVDAGVDAIGLHIENGNTPKVPELLGFYCRKAASQGSETTMCDGQKVWQAMPDNLKALFEGNINVSRTLSEPQWKAYLAQEHPLLQSAEQVTELHLHEMMGVYEGQSASLNADGSLNYTLSISPKRVSSMSGTAAFANAILGPSFNYEPPRYQLASGEYVSDDLIETLRSFAEQFTVEIHWQDQDIVLLDNWRVMHGRRAIEDASNRELFVGMGMVR